MRKGQKHSDETKEKIRKAMTNKKKSTYTKHKISLSLKDYYRRERLKKQLKEQEELAELQEEFAMATN